MSDKFKTPVRTVGVGIGNEEKDSGNSSELEAFTLSKTAVLERNRKKAIEEGAFFDFAGKSTAKKSNISRHLDEDEIDSVKRNIDKTIVKTRNKTRGFVPERPPPPTNKRATSKDESQRIDLPSKPKNKIIEFLKNNPDFSFGTLVLFVLILLFIVRNFFSIKSCSIIDVDKNQNIDYINNQLNKLQSNSKDNIISDFNSVKLYESLINHNNFPEENKGFIISDLKILNNNDKYIEIKKQIDIAEKLLEALKNKNNKFTELQNAKNNTQGLSC